MTDWIKIEKRFKETHPPIKKKVLFYGYHGHFCGYLYSYLRNGDPFIIDTSFHRQLKVTHWTELSEKPLDADEPEPLDHKIKSCNVAQTDYRLSRYLGGS